MHIVRNSEERSNRPFRAKSLALRQGYAHRQRARVFPRFIRVHVPCPAALGEAGRPTRAAMSAPSPRACTRSRPLCGVDRRNRAFVLRPRELGCELRLKRNARSNVSLSSRSFAQEMDRWLGSPGETAGRDDARGPPGARFPRPLAPFACPRERQIPVRATSTLNVRVCCGIWHVGSHAMTIPPIVGRAGQTAVPSGGGRSATTASTAGGGARVSTGGSDSTGRAMAALSRSGEKNICLLQARSIDIGLIDLAIEESRPVDILATVL